MFRRLFHTAIGIRLKACLDTIYASDLILFTLLSILLISISLLRPHIPYDTIAYHLPFGVKLVHLEKAGDFSLYSKCYGEGLEYRFLGFPTLPYYILGYLFQLFGKSLRVLPLISAIPLILLALSVKNLFNLSRSLFLFACFAVPMIAIHSHCSYIDMFTGILVASLAFITIKLLEFQPSFKERCYLGIIFIIISFLCGQTKFFAIPFVCPLALISAWASLSRCKDRKQGLLLAGIFAVAVCVSSLKLLTNWVQFNNPFYPIATMMFKGPQGVWSTDPGYLSFLGPLARPIYFITSLTELDLWIRGIKPLYSLDRSGESDLVFTAGFGFLCVIAFLLWEIFYYKTISDKDVRVKYSLIVLIILLTINSIMPQSHVLRYWMYIPFVALLLVLLQLEAFSINVRRLFILSAAILSCINMIYTLSYDRLVDFKLNPTPRFEVHQIQEIKPAYVCTGDKVYFPFLFSTVMNDGDWKTNTPECNENNNACKCFIDFDERAFSFNFVNCN